MTLANERLQLRVDPATKRRLERAAEQAHQTLTAFMLTSGELHAQEVLADRAVITLSPEAAERFATALAHPAEVNERLAARLRRPSTFNWLD